MIYEKKYAIILILIFSLASNLSQSTGNSDNHERNTNKISDIEKLEAIYYSQKKAYSKKKRHRIIFPSTMTRSDADYLYRWLEHTQKFGNANYPQGEQYNKLFGDVLLEIVVKHNGDLKSVKVIGSSGSKVLDDIAIRTVKMAAPFPKFGKKLHKELDSIQFLKIFRYRKSD